MPGWGPLPIGPGATQMIKDLRAMNAQIYGTIFASSGVISGDVTIEGTFIGNDYLSSNWDGAIPVALTAFDATATAGFAWDASLGSAQLMGNLWNFGDIYIGDPGDVHMKLRGSAGIIEFLDLSHGADNADTPTYIDSALVDEGAGYFRYDTTIYNGQWTGGSDVPWIRMVSYNPLVPAGGWMAFGVGALSDDFMSINEDGIIAISTSADMRFDSGSTLGFNEFGSATVPSLAWNDGLGNYDTGLYRPSADVIGFTIAGTLAMNLSGGANGRIRLSSGAGAGTPGFSWLDDTDTGMFRTTANIIGFAAGGNRVLRIRQPGTSSTVGTRNSGILDVFDDNVTLGSTAGNIVHLLSTEVATGNNVALELQAIRDANGSDWTTMAIGFRRITDSTSQSSLWWKGSQIIVNGTSSQYARTLAVNGTIEHKPDTTGSNSAGYVGGTNSWWKLSRNTSARKYKRFIDYDILDELAAMTLMPAKFYRPDDDRWWVDFIADDVAALNPIFGEYDETTGEIENYHKPSTTAILAAKVIKLEAEVKELKRGVH